MFTSFTHLNERFPQKIVDTENLSVEEGKRGSRLLSQLTKHSKVSSPSPLFLFKRQTIRNDHHIRTSRHQNSRRMFQSWKGFACHRRLAQRTNWKIEQKEITTLWGLYLVTSTPRMEAYTPKITKQKIRKWGCIFPLTSEFGQLNTILSNLRTSLLGHLGVTNLSFVRAIILVKMQTDELKQNKIQFGPIEFNEEVASMIKDFQIRNNISKTQVQNDAFEANL